MTSRRRFVSLDVANLVLDPLGGETQKKSIGVLREGGILVSLVQPPDQKLLAQRSRKAARCPDDGLFTNVTIGEHVLEDGRSSRPPPAASYGLLADGKIRVLTEATFRVADRKGCPTP